MGASTLLISAGAVRAPGRISSASRVAAWTERMAAGAALAVLAPVLGGVMAVVRMLSGRSPLVAHRRVGFDGESFWVLKIRTMWDGSRGYRGWVERLDDPEVPRVKRERDPRVTSRFAGFCRKHSIDELPQLWHVVRGEMRLVGPRPMTRVELDQHYGLAAEELLRVRPGLTGLWQVMGRNRLTYAQRRRLDLFFVRRRCRGLYWKVLARTVREVIAPRDAC